MLVLQSGMSRRERTVKHLSFEEAEAEIGTLLEVLSGGFETLTDGVRLARRCNLLIEHCERRLADAREQASAVLESGTDRS
jgi:exonuclease VII small subunit